MPSATRLRTHPQTDRPTDKWGFWAAVAAKTCLFRGFIILKIIGYSSRVKLKIWFWNICCGSRDIYKNMSEFYSLNQTFKFWHILTNISGSNAKKSFSPLLHLIVPPDLSTEVCLGSSLFLPCISSMFRVSLFELSSSGTCVGLSLFRWPLLHTSLIHYPSHNFCHKDIWWLGISLLRNFH